MQFVFVIAFFFLSSRAITPYFSSLTFFLGLSFASQKYLRTPLGVATMKSNASTEEVLLEAGADIEATDKISYKTRAHPHPLVSNNLFMEQAGGETGSMCIYLIFLDLF